MGREDERPTSWPPSSLEGVFSEELVQCLLFRRGARWKLQPLAKWGRGATGRDLPRLLETSLARTRCAPTAAFQKRLVSPVPSEPGSDGGLPGVAQSSLSPGLTEAAAPPG